MTNLPKLSNRASAALDVLSDGGQFSYRLERNSYTGREQFQYRLERADGSIVKGIGLHAFYELQDGGFLTQNYSTSVSSYYQLKREA